METNKYIIVDNYKIHYVINSNNNDSIVIMIHGFGVDNHENGNFDKLSKELINKGYDYIRIDLLGHGESEGSSLDLTVAYGNKILDELLKVIDGKYKNINLLGSSFGAAIVSTYQNKVINKRILWSPLLDLYNNIIKPSNVFTKMFLGDKGIKGIEKYGYVEFGLSGKKIGMKAFDEARVLKPYLYLDNNILILHGDNDLVVPISQSMEIANNNKNIKFVAIKNGSHCFYDDTINEVIEYTIDFLGE